MNPPHPPGSAVIVSTEGTRQNRRAADRIQVSPELHKGFALDDIEVFPHDHVVLRDGQQYHLSNKSMEVLLLFASHPGEILSREHICGFIWGDRDGHSAALTHAIGEIRQALKDDKDLPRFIQTLPRRGYRLIMPVSVLGQRQEHHAGSNAQLKKTLGQWRRKRLFKAGVTYIVGSWLLMQVANVTLPIFNAEGWHDKILLLVLIALFPFVLLYAWWAELRFKSQFLQKANNVSARNELVQRARADLTYIALLGSLCLSVSYLIYDQALQPRNAIQRDFASQDVIPNTVLVLPFKTMGEVSQSDLAGMLNGELISFLSQFQGINLVSERSVLALPANADLQLIQQRTKAEYVLEGIINGVENMLIVHSTLTNTVTGFTEWSGEVSVAAGNPLLMFEKLSRQISAALTFLASGNQQDDSQFKPTEDFQAFDLYLQGKQLLRDAHNLAQLEQAERLFASALQRDNRFLLALSGLCRTQVEEYRISQSLKTFEMAMQNCQQIGLDERRRAESEIALGALFRQKGEYSTAIEHLEIALAADEDNSEALSLLAEAYALNQQSGKAEQFFHQAITTDPGFWRNYQQYGNFLFEQGKYKDAAVQFELQTTLQPDSEMAFNNLGAAYFMANDMPHARQAWQQALAIQPSAPTYSNLASVAFYEHDFVTAAALYRHAIELRPENVSLVANWADSLKFVNGQQENARLAYQEALQLARNSLMVNPNDNYMHVASARYLAELDQCDSAREITLPRMAKFPADPYIFYELALIASHCGQANEVQAMLQKAISLGYPAETLRQDPQFSAFTSNIEQLILPTQVTK